MKAKLHKIAHGVYADTPEKNLRGPIETIVIRPKEGVDVVGVSAVLTWLANSVLDLHQVQAVICCLVDSLGQKTGKLYAFVEVPQQPKGETDEPERLH